MTKEVSHCPHGHEWTDENTNYQIGEVKGKKYRHRTCRACKTRSAREYYARHGAKIRAASNAYGVKHRVEKRAYGKAHYARNKVEIAATGKIKRAADRAAIARDALVQEAAARDIKKAAGGNE